jgi:hypothetical protein
MLLYNIRPGFTLGTAPAEVQQLWNGSNCDYKVCSWMRSAYNIVPTVD